MPFTPTFGLLTETSRMSTPVPVVESTVMELPVGLMMSGVGSFGEVKPFPSL